jgi:hypothetical protein
MWTPCGVDTTPTASTRKPAKKGRSSVKKMFFKEGKVIFIKNHDTTIQAKVNERVDIFFTPLIFVSYKLNSCNLIGLKRTNDNQEATFTVGSPRGRQPMPGSHASLSHFLILSN